LVKACPVCSRDFITRAEPLIPSKLPDFPWQKVGSDLFNLKGTTYLVVVDYFSRWPEVVKLTSTTSKGVIEALKSIFSRHGTPQVLMSDNGPQYSSQEFAEFSRVYNFSHITTSPHFPQSNGMAERAVQMVKSLLKDSDDPNLALLCYRTTPLAWCNISPAELLMGRRLRTNLPQLDEQLRPGWPELSEKR
jgi:transposase InsO family protein